MTKLQTVSITGADDNTSLNELKMLGAHFPFVEWGLLYVPGKEGQPRNPGAPWRREFFEDRPEGSCAVHLCGAQAFHELLADQLPSEILKADRLQLNVNARRPEFSHDQVLAIYRKALSLESRVILQRHEFTVDAVDEFLRSLDSEAKKRVAVLLDESRGKGITPTVWAIPAGLPADVAVIFAGGMGPHNVATILPQLEALGVPYSIDMESGVRDEANAFNYAKVERTLAASEPYAVR